MSQLLSEDKYYQVVIETLPGYDDPVVVKSLKEDCTDKTYAELRLINEYEITSNLDFPGIRKALKLSQHEGLPGLVLQYIPGQTIKKVQEKRRFTLKDVLKISVALAKLINNIHQRNVFHQNINPSNILISENAEVSLIDFSLASKIEIKKENQHPTKIEGELAYISPEQTGRINRIVDYRTDIYSFGIIMYELIAGQLPFISDDPVKMIHYCLAKTPPGLADLNQDVPQIISDIVSRLISKNAEDRYASMDGAIHDLENCFLQYNETGTIKPFEIGQQDYSPKLKFPEKIFGRENELSQLKSIFFRTSVGQPEIVFLSGPTGIGKTSVVNELQKTIFQEGGLFLKGSFSNNTDNIPYQGFIQIFSQFIEYILSGDNDTLEYYRKKIIESLGINAGLMNSVVPELKNLIGQTEEPVSVGLDENQRRFSLTLQNFVSSICDDNNQLVIFLDDLQWSDQATIEMINLLVSSAGIKNLLIIASYRNNEIEANHPLQTLISELQTNNLATFLEILPLKNIHLNSLLCELLNRKEEEVKLLSQVIYQKTAGNAYFLKEFLETLHLEEKLVFDNYRKQWAWDLEEIKKLNVTDNVVDLLLQKIGKIPDSTRQYLFVASCLGKKFNAKLIEKIAASDPIELIDSLNHAVQADLIAPLNYQYANIRHINNPQIDISDNHFEFPHGKIRQAIYSLISIDEKQRLHYEIGKCLKEDLVSNKDEKLLFETANHFNRSSKYLNDSKEKSEVARANLMAGQIAKYQTAYDLALDYFTKGVDLLEDDSWKTDYQLSLALYEEATQAAYSCSSFELMQRFAESVIQNSKNSLDRISTYETLILSYDSQGEFDKAIDTAFKVLNELGLSLNRQPGQFTILTKLISIKTKLIGKDLNMLENQPVITNSPEVEAALKIIYRIFSVTYKGFPELFVTLVLETLKLNIKHGISKESAFGFALYGVVLQAGFKDYKSGLKLANLSLRLTDKFEEKRFYPPVYAAVYQTILHFNEDIHQILPKFLQAFQYAQESGELFWSAVHLCIYSVNSFWAGKNLDELKNEVKQFIKILEQQKEQYYINWLRMILQTIENLAVGTDTPAILEGQEYDGKEGIERFKKYGDVSVLTSFHTLQQYLGYQFNDYENAQSHTELAKPYLKSSEMEYGATSFLFHKLLLDVQMIQADESLRKKRMPEIKSMRKKFIKWNSLCPENYASRYHIIEGSICELNNLNGKAIEYYNKAIEIARKRSFIHEEALTWDLLGRLYEKNDFAQMASISLINASDCYYKWGARKKAEKLRSEFPALISKAEIGINTTEFDSLNDNQSWDLQSFIRASNAISGEIVLEKLLTSLLYTLLENTGASKALLVLNKKHHYSIVAQSDVDHQSNVNLEGVPINNSELLAETVVQYVIRSNNDVVLKDARSDRRFSRDKYITKNDIKSILCIPVIHQQSQIAVVYLENNLTINAFTRKRVEITRILAGQVAISLNNALLYEDMENQVMERTKQIEEERKKSEKLLLNILPGTVANELKLSGKAKARRYEDVSVLFTDFVGFTRLAEGMTPEQLLDELDYVFTEFDDLVERNGLEKIKTTGDSYMCVASLPDPDPDGAEKITDVAIEMQKIVTERKKIREQNNSVSFDMRIGIHTGHVVAGVVGHKKFAFDLWGNTVNIASRMESNGEAGKINISEQTYNLIEDKFNCTCRGKINAKNIGNIAMYFVDGKKI